jgi:hypothetical protein
MLQNRLFVAGGTNRRCSSTALPQTKNGRAELPVNRDNTRLTRITVGRDKLLAPQPDLSLVQDCELLDI